MVASRKRHELSFKAANRIAASAHEASMVALTVRGYAMIWGSAQVAAIATSSARVAAICFSAAKCSLRSCLYCVHHGLGRRLFDGGVGDLGGRCRARASGRGMWVVEGGGEWGSGVDYLPG